MTFAHELEDLGSSTQHLLHTVATLGEDDWRGPSLLPDWTRAHVVAHLVLNAEGLTGAVEGVVRGRPRPVYASSEARDGDIAELAARPRSVVRERLEESTAGLATALSSLSSEQHAEQVERVPGGPGWPVAAITRMRRREVEIHHADLGTSYRPADWPPDFCRELLDHLAGDRADRGPFTILATDLGRSWAVGGAGDGDPSVRGSAADLGWWLAGRGASTSLQADPGPLPDLGRWR